MVFPIVIAAIKLALHTSRYIFKFDIALPNVRTSSNNSTFLSLKNS